MTTTKSNTIEVNLSAGARFRAEIFPIGGNASATSERGEWRLEYSEAEADLVTLLVNKGIGYAGEVDKIYATSNSWDKVDADKAAADAAKAAKL